MSTPRARVEPVSLLQELQDKLSGDVAQACADSVCHFYVADADDDNEAYERARKSHTWNLDAMGTPAAIVSCASPAAVAAVVQCCTASSLDLCVAGGRHSHQCLVTNAVCVDLTTLMGGVRVDATARRAYVQGGALLGALDAACAPHGLAVTAGHHPGTGVGGLTLQGGHGFLERVLGLAVDSLVRMTVVLADGTVVTTSVDEHPDLFWALRGGGGNFGIVTEFVFALHPLPNKGRFWGGVRVHPAAPFSLGNRLVTRRECFAHWQRLTRDPPLEFSGNMVSLCGGPVVEVTCYVAEPDDPRAVAFMRDEVKSFNKWPLADDVSRDCNYYTGLQRSVLGPDGKMNGPGYYYMKGLYVDVLSDELCDAMAACVNGGPSGGAIVTVLCGGRGSTSEPAEGTAVGNRHFTHWIMVMCQWQPSLWHRLPSGGRWSMARDRAALVKWGYETMATLKRVAKTDEASFTFIDSGKDELGNDIDDIVAATAAVGAASASSSTSKQTLGAQLYSSERMARLLRVKQKYDPRNMFHHNPNIDPTTQK